MAGTALEVKVGIDALPVSAQRNTWTPEQGALMESLGLKGTKNRQVNGRWEKQEFEAPLSVVQAFLHQARTRGLDPFARQIYCIERGGKWGIEASIDGFRLQAERSGKYRGSLEPQWTDGTMIDVPVFHDGEMVIVNGQPLTKKDYVWVDAWVSSEPPAAARVGVLRSDFDEPVYATASYAGYCPRDRDGALKPTGQWQFNSSNQLAKCAEMLALRKGFPAELSGLYGAEEMDQATKVAVDAHGSRQSRSSTPVNAAVPSARNATTNEAIAAPKLTRDWVAEAGKCTDVAALTALANEADAAGEIGMVIDALRKRKAELEQPAEAKPAEAKPAEPKPAEPKKPTRKEWLERARAASTPDGVVAVWDAAHAANVSADLLDEIDAIGAKLAQPTPGPVESGEPVSSWPVVEPGSGGFEAEPGEVSF